ncbi:MAG: X-Pro aminopeptidase [Alphaproteobacteria bacterium]|nr:MAG: X-Pro aminopeptidase [Alphaproteobacteria bacterium]
MPENTTQYQGRLEKIRQELEKQELSGFILPRTDEFQGEFLADYAERLAWLSGFTGSAGAVVVLQDKAVVLSDGRYTLQMQNQVDGDLYMTDDSTKTSVGKWLEQHAEAGDRIGYDVWLFTPKQIKSIRDALEETSITLVAMDRNLVDVLWDDQPAKPKQPVTIFPDEIAGRSASEKRQDIAAQIKAQGCSACLLSLSDSICWLLNVRGGDVGYSPLVLSYGLLYADGTFDWFVDEDKVSKEVAAALGADVRLYALDQMGARIAALSGCVWMDRSSAPIWFEQAFKRGGIEMLNLDDPCIVPKSIKSTTEQEAVRTAHIHDGVAIVKFLHWLSVSDNHAGMSEISAEEQLESFRRENPAYLEPSFPTISGFAGNGAIVHYRATPQSNADISGNGILLVDSGGQYQWGTTDITRTVAINTPTQEQRENYTRVLQGHIALADAHFPKGTIGKEIDALARQPLKDVGLDYAHGTGHGVGCYLCVHEGAANISPRGEKVLEAGMLISNEPGYYKEGEYGIRIENLVLVRDGEETDMLQFETVTYAPYDSSLIDLSMLSDLELSWLQQYSQDVYQKLCPALSGDVLAWLKNEIEKLTV